MMITFTNQVLYPTVPEIPFVRIASCAGPDNRVLIRLRKETLEGLLKYWGKEEEKVVVLVKSPKGSFIANYWGLGYDETHVTSQYKHMRTVIE